MRYWMIVMLGCLWLPMRAQRPALIPQPRQLHWTTSRLPLQQVKTVLVTDSTLLPVARMLQQELSQLDVRTEIRWDGPATLKLQLSPFKSPGEAEGYRLSVDAKRVIIEAGTPHGIFNGMQTLLQLIVGQHIAGCEINDQPAFTWRGYMVDVGRNYQSLPLLKQQIAVMARYKLNVFQFHFTEDVAWRWQVPGFPQLTAPEHMLRNKGAYYTSADIQELIDYCRERYITLVPEIDMPGHSAAFKRAMGTDMQSDSGMQVMRQLLTVFCRTLDVPWLHIGGDEVKIIRPDFLPEMIQLVERMGKKTIGWDPGGNIPEHTVHQLWMRDGATKPHTVYIESRHLYVNHMDPLESVVTIFHRRLGDRARADDQLSGATLCVWHDRNVTQETDVLRMNPVYPAMVTFAERSWCGEGQAGWVASLTPAMLVAFGDFEKRLLQHQQQYFSRLPFTYARQRDLRWKLYGPFANNGDLQKDFRITGKPALQAFGGTLVLRHFWDPLVKGLLPEPQDSTTWYAVTHIRCDRDTILPVWINGADLSRSYASDTPPADAWDTRHSEVRVNGERITPPVWTHPGRKGNLEVPLTDEGYAYRSPVPIPFRKGLNEVIIRMPVGSFKAGDWQNPVKWMFTFIPLTTPFLRYE